MKNWRVRLLAGEKSLAKMKIQGVIFKEDALSSLLFVVTAN